MTKGQRIERAGKSEVASAKKPVRSPDNGVAPKSAAKNGGLVESGSAVQTKVDELSLPAGNVIPSDMVTRMLVAPRDQGGVTAKGLGEVSGAVIPSTAPASATSAGSTRDEAVQAANGVTGVEAPVTPMDASIASPKFGLGSEPARTSQSAGSDSDDKIQGVPVPVPGLTHVMSGGAETAAGSSPLVAAHGIAQGDLIGAKTQLGDAVLHSSGMQNGCEGPGGCGWRWRIDGRGAQGVDDYADVA